MQPKDQKEKIANEKPQDQAEQGNKNRDTRKDEEDVCVKAPEWAEHQRLSDDDLPCDDGRSGRH